jgi:ABC-type uncharacterized transport system permease subunit
MIYLAVKWKHAMADMPVEIISELDDSQMEVRKVEVFAKGTIGYASANTSVGGTALGLAPVPTAAQIAEEIQFSPREITREEFEAMWKKATGKA